ncbi:IS3 family transposase ISHahy4 [bioreactor metagenome]|uniref:IS3 family transposase ISHahy4 n=1 Tax=bioreactor metagenome TaxID=1076179 RepID=A0A644ZQX1_9ZZZZ
MILNFVGLAASTYYEYIKRQLKSIEKTSIAITKKDSGRPTPGYSYTKAGKKISDEQIKEWLCKLISSDGFPYGYRKLTICLKEDYNLIINHKKVYRLCKELNILRPQRTITQRHPKHLAKKETISAPNELWEIDIKYGYINGEDKFFFQLSLIDVFDRSIIDYHIGLSCKASDACNVLRNSLRKRNICGNSILPKIRTDNGPQFIAKEFEEFCNSSGLIHQRIPVKTPNMNAHIESFHSILEDECYSRNEWSSFKEAYKAVAEYMNYYNNRRRHGSIKYMAPNRFYDAFMSNTVNAKAFAA